MKTKFNENSNFDVNNRVNLIDDFYYKMELEKEQIVDKMLLVADDNDKLKPSVGNIKQI